jgi:putative SOS response-associated peptidase YedK
MCYAAQVIQLVRKLNRELGIRLDYDEAEKLFVRRLDEPTLNVSRGFEANFDEVSTDQGRRIKTAIEAHRSRAATKFEKDLFSQKTRFANAERSLKTKDTQKAREDIRIATNKIDALIDRLSDLRRSEPKPRDNRVFPMVYAGVIVKQDGVNVLWPMRYACRPAGKPAFYDKKFPGLYNARRDNLEKFWNEQYGHHHAVMVVDGFYENVQLHVKERRDLRAGEKEQDVVLQFTPNPPQTMLITCLWSHWTDSREPDLCSFAAITDEPPPDVAAAGHDRCIINLRPEHVDAWLTPEQRGREELRATLSDRAVSTFEYVALKAA